MKKYRLAKDFGVFKAPMEFKECGNFLELVADELISDSSFLQIHRINIPDFLAYGTIEEIPEPKWTDEDMMQFAKVWQNDDGWDISKFFQQWQEQRK